MFLSVVILGRFTTETPAMALSHHDRHAATTYTTPRDMNSQGSDGRRRGLYVQELVTEMTRQLTPLWSSNRWNGDSPGSSSG